MFKKIAAVVLAVLMMVSITAAFTGCSGGASADFKVGVILIGDETEGYSKAHMDGIKEAAKNLGIADNQIIWKYKVEENSTCLDAATDLVGQGCDLIISNSYGHQTYMVQVAEQFPDVLFASMTGDFAGISGLPNLKNAFTAVYESRYVSGVVAGMKIKELVEAGKLTDANYDADGNVKIGYVGAYPYAEVVSGYTAYFLGVKSVYEKVSMEVSFTNSWFDITAEATAAEADMPEWGNQEERAIGMEIATAAANLTFYFDDFTLDYSPVTPDRDAPIIGGQKNRWRLGMEHFYIQNSKTEQATEPKDQKDGPALGIPYDAGYSFMYDCVRDKKSLVFSNSREETEYLCATFRQISKNQEISILMINLYCS